MPDTIYHIKITADTAAMITTRMAEEAAAVDTEIAAMADKTTATAAKTDTIASLQSTRVVSLAHQCAFAVLILRFRHSQNRRHCLYQQPASRSD